MCIFASAVTIYNFYLLLTQVSNIIWALCKISVLLEIIYVPIRVVAQIFQVKRGWERANQVLP